MTNNSPEIYDGDITRNVDWKIKSFEFDNMFCYGKGNKIDFVSRNFAPKLGIPEDPVTGGAHCELIPYWAKRLNKKAHI